MGHSLLMNTLKTGQTEVGGSNESGQTDSSGESSEGEETDDEYKSDAPAVTLKTTQMMSFLLLSPQTRNMQTSCQLQHAQDEQKQKEPKSNFHSLE